MRDLIEGNPVLVVIDIQGGATTDSAIAAEFGVRPDDYVIPNRRYSWFFGTELQVLLNRLRASGASR